MGSNAANNACCSDSENSWKRYGAGQATHSNIYRRTEVPTFPEDRRGSQSVQETKSTDDRLATRVTLMKTAPATKKAGRNGQGEKTLHLSGPTDFEDTDQFVVYFEQ